MNTGTIIKQAEAYCAHTGRTLSTVGSYAVRDGKFFDRLKNGGGCTLRTADRVITWFSDNWPSDLTWPTDIPRPAPNRKEVA
ncbi:MAG: hypothetical protein GYB51_00085 [Rhodobacteraceae bacterium]|nr:hypothetical protein [Paracoccaceae bacterium]